MSPSNYCLTFNSHFIWASRIHWFVESLSITEELKQCYWADSTVRNVTSSKHLPTCDSKWPLHEIFKYGVTDYKTLYPPILLCLLHLQRHSSLWRYPLKCSPEPSTSLVASLQCHSYSVGSRCLQLIELSALKNHLSF